VARTINAMQRAFLIRTCSDSFYESRTRPCLLHQIKRCSAPCTGVISLDDYARLVKEAEDFLSGRSQAVRTEMQREMEAASERLDFEAAAVYRDRIAALSHIQGSQGINPRSIEEADLFAMHQEGGHTCVEVFFFRTGQNWGNRAYYPRADRSLEPAQVLGSFVAQFYDDKPIPKLILLSTEVEEMDLLTQALTEKAGHKVTLLVPQRGERREIVEQAVANAKEALGRELAQSATQKALLEGVAATFNLPAPPRRIEVYDNSHIMGTNPVGAMIVAGPEGFVKNQYRKFNMRSEDLTPGDDYAMMREMLTRRFSRLIREAAPREAPPESETMGPWPDLVLIDGGRGQLGAAQGVLAELGVADLPMVGVAKGPDRDAGRETFFVSGRDGFMLQPRDPVLYFIQRLRDEAHRFAIGSHRTRRRIDMARNPLDEIDGIGPTRKRALLRHFGTAKAVGRASVSDLLAVPGISEQTAQAIYDHFHEGG
jgi:excinuclease ABC subunit C